MQINNLGIPGVDFQPTQHRTIRWDAPPRRCSAASTWTSDGFAGVERYFDERLRTNTDPLRLSLDMRVQAAVREELLKAMDTFNAIGGAGIVMDVHTGEVAGDGQPARLRRQPGPHGADR